MMRRWHSLQATFMRAVFSILVVCSTLVLARGDTEVPLTFTRLDLTDGRKLKNVVVKTYDAKTEKLLVVADGKAMTISISSVPPPFNQQLKLAPPSGASVNTYSRAPVSMMDQYGRQTVVTMTDQYGRQVITPTNQHGAQRRISREEFNNAHRVATLTPQDPLLTEAGLTQHQAAAQQRAQTYFQYEFQVGSNSIVVTSLSFELDVPKPVPGWTGRCFTSGKAFIEYFDSKGRSYQRTTSTFEVTTEQRPGEGLKAIDFSRKS